MDWCPRNPHLLVTASDDNSVRIWRVNRRDGVAPEPGVVSGVAKREPVAQPDFSLAPRTPGGAASPFPRTPTTPRATATTPRSSFLHQTPKSSTTQQLIPRTPGSGSSVGFTPKACHASTHQQPPKTPTSRDFYSPTKAAPQSPSRSQGSNAGRTLMSPLASYFSPRALHYGTHTPVTPTQTPRTRRRSAALKGRWPLQIYCSLSPYLSPLLLLYL